MITLWLFVLFLTIYVCSKRQKLEKYPYTYPGALPFIGHTHQLIGSTTHLWDVLQNILKYSNENSGVVLLSICGENYYFITDPEDFATVSNTCLLKHFVYDYMKPWVGDGLISGNDLKIWKRHKKLLQPAFSQQVIDSFLPIFNNQSRKLVQDFACEVGKGLFYHSKYIEHRGMETICGTSFAMNEITKFNGNKYSEKVGMILNILNIGTSFAMNEITKFNGNKYSEKVGMILKIVTERSQKFWLQNELMFTLLGYKKRQDEAIAYVNDVFDMVINNKKMDINNGVVYKENVTNTFIDIVLQLEGKGKLTHKEIWEEVNTIIAAGYETVSSSLVYILILIGSHPAVQEKVWNELKEVFGESKRDVIKSDLSKLLYMEAVIKEAARFFTVAPVLLRQVDKDVKLTNLTMPKGSYCALLVSGLHRHPIWGNDANEFKPERWLDTTALANPKSALNMAFGVFGSGKRYCMGKLYAMMLMKTTLVHVLRHYRVSADVTKLKLRIAGLLKPESGHLISVEMRN